MPLNVLFFSPFSYFTVHSIPESIVAENLRKTGCQIYYLQCSGILSKCLAMYDVESTDIKTMNRICKRCQDNSKVIQNHFKDFIFSDLESFICLDLVQDLAQELLDGSSGDYLNIVYDGYEIGKFAFYELSINHKITDLKSASDSLLQEYSQAITNVLVALFAIQSYLKSHRIDRIVLYNALYSVNRIVMEVAQARNIPVYNIHAGSHTNRSLMLESLTIFKGINAQVLRNRHPVLAHYQTSPIRSSSYTLIQEFIRGYFVATSPFVYSLSPSKILSTDIKSLLRISDNQRVVLALPRSVDEVTAALNTGQRLNINRGLFENNFEWISWLNNFCKMNRDIFVVFRIHPREFPNKRESKQSDAANKMLSFLSSFQSEPNFYVNLPSDQLSISDLLKITDLMLNNSSSAPLQGLLMGIPCLGYGEHFVPFDPVLQPEVSTHKDYAAAILRMSHTSWSLRTSISAHRWLNYLLTEVSIDISRFYKAPTRRLVSRIINRLKKILSNPFFCFAPDGLLATSLKHAKPCEKLAYAITNNKTSHIGNYEPKFGDIRSEITFISQSLLLIAASISDERDHKFRSRIEALIEQASATEFALKE